MELPSGTVTFLFSDVEGSTRLWQEQPELMRRALPMHDALLRETFESYRGRVVKTTGDGFHVVFASAADAVRAVLAAQRELTSQERNDEFGSLRVRLVLHTGAADLRDGDYYGSSVNLAARLAAISHGGQVVLSQATAELVRDELPAQVDLLDLGVVQLKDVFRPVRVFQLAAPDLPTAFPPLASYRAAAVKAPVTRTPFIGREEELEAVEKLLLSDHVRLVTLLGPGGTGKTRLAIELAGRVREAFKDGVYFIDLAPIDKDELVASTIADAIGLRESANRPPIDMITHHLAGREVLLIIDNLEHLMGGVEVVEVLLASALKVKYLITSREATHLHEEWQYPLEGLPFPKNEDVDDAASYGAIALFFHSAQRVRPDFSSAGDVSAVIRICQLVGGLPLAIELAASWTNTLDVMAIAREIEGGIEILSTRMRNLPERHRSMRATFEYSWSQLSTKQRDVFPKLSVFRGGFQLGAAKQVAGASLLDLTELVEKSLLRWSPPANGGSSEGRYELHELLRQYAWEKLDEAPGALDDIRSRHSTYFVEILRGMNPDLNGRRQLEAKAAIAAELENVRAAWHTALDLLLVANVRMAGFTLHGFYQLQSRYLEGADEFGRAIETLRRLEPTTELKVIISELSVALGWLMVRLGRFDEAEAAFNESMHLSETEYRMMTRDAFDNPQMGLGVLANIRGDYSRAEKLAREMLQDEIVKTHRMMAMDAYYVLVNACSALGRYEEARNYGAQAIHIADEVGDKWMLGYILSDLGAIEITLGTIELAQGREQTASSSFEQARQYFRRSYELREKFNDPEGMAVALNGMGQIALCENAYTEAQTLFRQSRQIYQEIGDRGGLAKSLNGLGNAAAGQRDYLAAKEYFHEALTICERIQFIPLHLAVLADAVGWVAASQEPELGIELLSMVINHPAASQDTRMRAEQSVKALIQMLPEDVSERARERGRSADLQQAGIMAKVLVQRWIEEEPEVDDAGADRAGQDLLEPLTARELEVLRLMAEGMSNPEIADKLVIAIGTVKSYTAQVYGKLGVNNRVRAVTLAREKGLL